VLVSRSLLPYKCCATGVSCRLASEGNLYITLYLVPCGSPKPTAEEEKGAVLLDDPSQSLRE